MEVTMRRRPPAIPWLAALCLGLSATFLVLLPALTAAATDVVTIDWKDLVPPGYDPDQLLRQYTKDVARLKDNDPRAEKLAEALRKAWENAPVVASLNNKTVRLSGFLVALDGDGKTVSEFLLVPFFGACIHVPPPPSNQIVLVRTGTKPFKAKEMFQTVMVTGRLRTEATRNDMANASYVIDASKVEAHTPR
jgi:hypothetical protein